MTDTPLLPITAAICTRNRGASLVPTLESIFSNDHPDFKVIVIDQSANDDTQNAIAPFLSDPRLRYVHSDTVGVARARNIALRLAETEIVAMTDDDCRVPTDWLRHMQNAFCDSRIALVYCNVEAAPHDPQKGFMAHYVRDGSHLINTVRQRIRHRGIGGGMALHREKALALGGFDELLGAGSLFPSAEEWDLATRILLKGQCVYETDTTEVLHFGFRPYEQRRAMVRRDYLGIAASFTKPLKAGHWEFWIIPAQFFVADAIWPMVRDLIHWKRPRGKTEIITFLHGTYLGWRTPVDRQSLLFQEISNRPRSPNTARTDFVK